MPKALLQKIPCPLPSDFGFADRGEFPLVLLARNGTGGSVEDVHADWVCVL
jgi:hypothetical protein